MLNRHGPGRPQRCQLADVRLPGLARTPQVRPLSKLAEHSPRLLAFSGSAATRSSSLADDARSGISAGACGRLPRRQAERFAMARAIMIGQDLGEVARPVRDTVTADLPAGDRTWVTLTATGANVTCSSLL